MSILKSNLLPRRIPAQAYDSPVSWANPSVTFLFLRGGACILVSTYTTCRKKTTFFWRYGVAFLLFNTVPPINVFICHSGSLISESFIKIHKRNQKLWGCKVLTLLGGVDEKLRFKKRSKSRQKIEDGVLWGWLSFTFTVDLHYVRIREPNYRKMMKLSMWINHFCAKFVQ